MQDSNDGPSSRLDSELDRLLDLPPEQREVWRMIFDHFIFCANGDPVAHLPEHAKGAFGPGSPELLARMRATLREIMRKP